MLGAFGTVLPMFTAIQAQGVQQSNRDTLQLTLDDALRYAVERSQEVRLANSEVSIARSQVRGARSAALPQVTGSLNYTRTFDSPFRGAGISIPDSLRFEPDSTASILDRIRYLEDRAPSAGLGGLGALFSDLPFGQVNTYVAMVTASQPIFAAGRIGAALKIAHEYNAAARLNLDEQLSEIELQTRSAYVRAQLALELETIAEAAVVQADTFLSQERLRLDAGTASELDVLRAEVSAENLRPQLVEARNTASLALLDLKRILDLPASTEIDLTSPLVAPTTSESESLRMDISLEDRPALRAAERQVAMREQQVKIARAAHLPSVDLSVNYGRQAFPARVFEFSGVDWRTDFNAVVGVRVPIFSGFRTSSETQQASIVLDQERLRLDQMRENIHMQHEQAVGERARAAASLTARQRTVDQATRVYDLTVLRYDEGLATQLEVTDARLALLQSRTSLAQAIADYHLATAAVRRARGETTVTR